MPIYEYQCTACSERHEIIQNISDTPLAHCPSCGGAMKKLFSSPAIQFKGSGFYKTDYASSGSKGESKSDSKSESKGESSSSSDASKSDSSKSDTKAASTSTKAE